jgi:four helix bundle protein
MERTNFEKLRVYQLSEQLSDRAWEVASRWESLAQKTVGIQFIKSADSIGANIAEGSGRGSLTETRRFAKIARGSLFEVKHWLRRAYKRNLLSQVQINIFQEIIEELTPKLSAYINSLVKNG